MIRNIYFYLKLILINICIDTHIYECITYIYLAPFSSLSKLGIY